MRIKQQHKKFGVFISKAIWNRRRRSKSKKEGKNKHESKIMKIKHIINKRTLYYKFCMWIRWTFLFLIHEINFLVTPKRRYQKNLPFTIIYRHRTIAIDWNIHAKQWAKRREGERDKENKKKAAKRLLGLRFISGSIIMLRKSSRCRFCCVHCAVFNTN